MVDGPGYKDDPKLKEAILEVITSDAFAAPLASAITKALAKSASEVWRAKSCRCGRCGTPPAPCRPPLTVMCLPIPVLNPFWWVQACQPPQHCRPHCGPRIPECCHEHPYTPSPGHPVGTVA
jgi:hypothetical protein